MSIQDFGSIGELLAALATLGTLIYLAQQIKQNTRSFKSQSRFRALEGVNADSGHIFSSENHDFLWKFLRQDDPPDEDKSRFRLPDRFDQPGSSVNRLAPSGIAILGSLLEVQMCTAFEISTASSRDPPFTEIVSPGSED